MEGLTVECNVTCGNVGFLGLGNVRFGCIGEIFCCFVVVTVSLFLHLRNVMVFEDLIV